MVCWLIFWLFSCSSVMKHLDNTKFSLLGFRQSSQHNFVGHNQLKDVFIGSYNDRIMKLRSILCCLLHYMDYLLNWFISYTMWVFCISFFCKFYNVNFLLGIVSLNSIVKNAIIFLRPDYLLINMFFHYGYNKRSCSLSKWEWTKFMKSI